MVRARPDLPRHSASPQLMYTRVAPGRRAAPISSSSCGMQMTDEGDRHAALLNTSLCAAIVYRLISPPMLEPPMAVSARPGRVGQFAST